MQSGCNGLLQISNNLLHHGVFIAFLFILYSDWVLLNYNDAPPHPKKESTRIVIS
jgi:hypothetical protein